MGWTSGMVGPDAEEGAADAVKPEDLGLPRKFHIVTSAQGSAVHWQTRVHYYWCVRHAGAQHRCGMHGPSHHCSVLSGALICYAYARHMLMQVQEAKGVV